MALKAIHTRGSRHDVSQPLAVKANGTLKGTRPTLNFGSTFTVADDSANNEVDVSISLSLPHSISSISQWSVGEALAMTVTPAAPNLATSWPTANLAYYVPFYLPMNGTVKRVWWYNGSAVSGNVDCGIYNEDLTRAVSLGSTAQAGTSVVQFGNIADTALVAGRYWMALALDNTTGRIARFASDIELLAAFGCAQEASAFALPATATLAATAQANHFVFGLEIGTLT